MNDVCDGFGSSWCRWPSAGAPRPRSVTSPLERRLGWRPL